MIKEKKGLGCVRNFLRFQARYFFGLLRAEYSIMTTVSEISRRNGGMRSLASLDVSIRMILPNICTTMTRIRVPLFGRAL